MGGAGAEAELYKGGAHGALFGCPQIFKAIFKGQALHHKFCRLRIFALVIGGQGVKGRYKLMHSRESALNIFGMRVYSARVCC